MPLDFNEKVFAMKEALKQAKLAFYKDEVPVGAVIINKDGTIVARAYNKRECASDPTAHAEILALRKAAKKVGQWRLDKMTLVVTLEPCLMCLAACVLARIQNVIFGAYDVKGGALSLGYSMHVDSRLNHRFSVMGGILHEDCSHILSDFFKNKRRKD